MFNIYTAVDSLQVGFQGTPLYIIETKSFDNWLSKQPTFRKNWLSAIFKNSEKTIICPNSEGKIDCVVDIVNSLEHAFCASRLPAKLPAGDYFLQNSQEHLFNIGFSWLMGSYQYNHFKSAQNDPVKLNIDDQECYKNILTQARATYLVRDLINTPAENMTPKAIAEVAENMGKEFGASFSQLVDHELIDNNYPLIYAVGRASQNSPRLIELNWGNQAHPEVCLVGKGVCFDTGGLQLKNKEGMKLMKKDMGGAAHVLGLAQMIMTEKLPVKLRVLIPAVENAIGPTAMRPGDVLNTRSGKTIEVVNTDAEGRLILADALFEACSNQPALVIDFATLTGAMRMALGTELPGFFCNNEQIANDLHSSGLEALDSVWRMPLHQDYKRFYKSQIADFINCSSAPQGKAIAAALLLEEFIQPGTNWLHFDVMGYNLSEQYGCPKGGEAQGLRAVFGYLKSSFR